MGRKSSAKGLQNRAAPGSGAAAPSPPRSSGSSRSKIGPILAAAVLVSVVAFIAYTRSSGSQASQGAPLETPPPPQQTAIAETAPPVLGPHPQANLPPLPMVPGPPARPIEIVRATYTFAAEHPEVLSYVPCYCGCERGGHRGNEDCFVTRRDANGDVAEWEPHGVT